ncbi:dihydroxyacetone kinase subunit DhaK [Proteus mirabilis]|uniref:Dihydroxyacetone kinase subunit DhaK n=1 Tax=Proteus mirabilis TaxID=584 RepID=A0A379GBI3_PROMI|nr:dihydroxyacetone kinase subunit DhaK [Proteus mirabilis]
MKKLINRVDDVLSEQLQGFAKAHPEINLHPSSFYVTRHDAPVKGKVALLSGGGSGMSQCMLVLLEKACLMGHVLVRSLPHQPQIKCTIAQKQLIAVKVY